MIRKTAIEASPSARIAFAGPMVIPIVSAPMYVSPAENTAAGTSVYKYERNLADIIVRKSDLDLALICRSSETKSKNVIRAIVSRIIPGASNPSEIAPSIITTSA